MLSSNNTYEIMRRKTRREVPHYGLRKTTLGVASVLLGTTLFWGANDVHAQVVPSAGNQQASAPEVNTNYTPAFTPESTTQETVSQAPSVQTSVTTQSVQQNVQTQPVQQTATQIQQQVPQSVQTTPQIQESFESTQYSVAPSYQGGYTTQQAVPSEQKPTVGQLMQSDYNYVANAGGYQSQNQQSVQNAVNNVVNQMQSAQSVQIQSLELTPTEGQSLVNSYDNQATDGQTVSYNVQSTTFMDFGNESSNQSQGNVNWAQLLGAELDQSGNSSASSNNSSAGSSQSSQQSLNEMERVSAATDFANSWSSGGVVGFIGPDHSGLFNFVVYDPSRQNRITSTGMYYADGGSYTVQSYKAPGAIPLSSIVRTISIYYPGSANPTKVTQHLSDASETYYQDYIDGGTIFDGSMESLQSEFFGYFPEYSLSAISGYYEPDDIEPLSCSGVLPARSQLNVTVRYIPTAESYVSHLGSGYALGSQNNKGSYQIVQFDSQGSVTGIDIYNPENGRIYSNTNFRLSGIINADSLITTPREIVTISPLGDSSERDQYPDSNGLSDSYHYAWVTSSDGNYMSRVDSYTGSYPSVSIQSLPGYKTTVQIDNNKASDLSSVPALSFAGQSVNDSGMRVTVRYVSTSDSSNVPSTNNSNAYLLVDADENNQPVGNWVTITDVNGWNPMSVVPSQYSYAGYSYATSGNVANYTIYVQHKHSTETISHVFTRTIIYKFPSNMTVSGSPVASQVITFNGDRITDEVTGSVSETWGDPTPVVVASSVISPSIPGLVPDVSVVPDLDVTPTTSNVSAIVTYSYASQPGSSSGSSQSSSSVSIPVVSSAVYSLIDTNANDSVVQSDVVISDKSAFMPNTVILPSGYIYNGDSYAIDGNGNETYVIYMSHKIDQTPISATITRTISFVFPAGFTGSMSPAVQTVTFNGQQTKDEVTGSINTVWGSNTSFSEVIAPSMANLVASPASIAAMSVTPTTSNVSLSIVYSYASQSGSSSASQSASQITSNTYSLIDMTENNSVVDSNIAIDDVSTFSPNTVILPSGYQYNGDSYAMNDGNVTYVIYMTHKIDQTPVMHTVSRTINFVLPAGVAGSISPAVQTMNFNGIKTHDEVTGSTNTQWASNGTFDAFDAPEMSGMIANPSYIDSMVVTPTTSDTSLTVYYSLVSSGGSQSSSSSSSASQSGSSSVSSSTSSQSGGSQMATAVYSLVDVDENNRVVSSNVAINDVGTFNPLTMAMPNGYQFAGDSFAMNGTQLVYTISVRHKIDSQAISHDVVRTVSFNIPAAAHITMSPDVASAVFYGFSMHDEVTGLNWNHWGSQTVTLPEVENPIVPGYYADKTIGASEVNPSTVDMSYVVNFIANGSQPSSSASSSTSSSSASQPASSSTSSSASSSSASQSASSTSSSTSQSSSTAPVVENTYSLVDIDENNRVLQSNVAISDTGNFDPTQVSMPSGYSFAGDSYAMNDGGVIYVISLRHLHSYTETSHTVTRTINFVLPAGFSGSIEPAVQTITFNGIVNTDEVTGSISTQWGSDDNFDPMTVPEVPGCTPDVSEIGGMQVTPTTSDVVITVHYSRNGGSSASSSASQSSSASSATSSSSTSSVTSSSASSSVTSSSVQSSTTSSSVSSSTTSSVTSSSVNSSAISSSAQGSNASSSTSSSVTSSSTSSAMSSSVNSSTASSSVQSSVTSSSTNSSALSSATSSVTSSSSNSSSMSSGSTSSGVQSLTSSSVVSSATTSSGQSSMTSSVVNSSAISSVIASSGTSSVLSSGVNTSSAITLPSGATITDSGWIISNVGIGPVRSHHQSNTIGSNNSQVFVPSLGVPLVKPSEGSSVIGSNVNNVGNSNVVSDNGSRNAGSNVQVAGSQVAGSVTGSQSSSRLGNSGVGLSGTNSNYQSVAAVPLFASNTSVQAVTSGTNVGTNSGNKAGTNGTVSSLNTLGTNGPNNVGTVGQNAGVGSQTTGAGTDVGTEPGTNVATGNIGINLGTETTQGGQGTATANGTSQNLNNGTGGIQNMNTCLVGQASTAVSTTGQIGQQSLPQTGTKNDAMTVAGLGIVLGVGALAGAGTIKKKRE